MNREFQPTDPLGNVLRDFQAPTGAMSSIGRRAGLVVARGELSINKIKDTIISSMSEHSGLPDWKNVDSRVGEAVNDVYRKSRRF
jgi:hypothetical protein